MVKIRVVYAFFTGGYSGLFYLETAEHGTYSGYQLLGIKWFAHIIVSSQLQPENLVEGFNLGGEYDDRYVGGMADFAAYLVTVNSRKHQVKHN